MCPHADNWKVYITKIALKYECAKIVSVSDCFPSAYIFSVNICILSPYRPIGIMAEVS